MRSTGILLVLLLTAQVGHAFEPEKWALMQRAVLVDQDASQIRALVASGVDLNDPIGCGTFAPLDGAVSRENAELVELLLSLGAKPRDRQIVTAAFAAKPVAGLKIVKLLRTAGVSVNARDYYAQTERFMTPMHQAVWRENVDLVRYLLSEPGVLLDELNVDGRTPLMIAVEKGNRQIFDMLLAAGANPKVKNARGLDADGVAQRIIAQQELFQAELKQHSTGR
jgi:ankyrin repeat protein